MVGADLCRKLDLQEQSWAPLVYNDLDKFINLKDYTTATKWFNTVNYVLL